MFTLEGRDFKRIFTAYVAASAFCAVFAVVYEIFAHGIISYWMIGMPFFPIILGVLPCALLIKSKISHWALQLWNCGVITLTVGSLLNGIFEIFGTYFDYFLIFMGCGTLLLILGSAIQITKKK